MLPVEQWLNTASQCRYPPQASANSWFEHSLKMLSVLAYKVKDYYCALVDMTLRIEVVSNTI